MMCSEDGLYLYSEKEYCAKAVVNQSSFWVMNAEKPNSGKNSGRNQKLSLEACEEINVGTSSQNWSLRRKRLNSWRFFILIVSLTEKSNNAVVYILAHTCMYDLIVWSKLLHQDCRSLAPRWIEDEAQNFLIEQSHGILLDSLTSRNGCCLYCAWSRLKPKFYKLKYLRQVDA